MDFFRMECFLKTAEAGNLTRAAERMNITQPAMSFQIRELEKEVQLTLLERDRNRIRLTGAGEIMRDGFVRILDGYRELLENARACAYGKARLAIGYNGPVNWAGISKFVGAFSQKNPNVEVALLQQQWKELADYLELGILDLIFVERSELANRRDLKYRVLFQDEACFAMAPSHPLTKKDFLTAEDLTGETILMNNHASSSMAAMIQRLEKAGALGKNCRFFDHTDITLTMAAAGQGLAPVPGSFRVENNALCYIPFRSSVFHMEHCVAWHRGREEPVLMDFLDTLEKDWLSVEGGSRDA